MLNDAINMKSEKMIWEKWIAIYPNMTKETFIPFDEFLRKHEPIKKSSESEKQQAREKAEKIRRKMVKK